MNKKLLFSEGGQPIYLDDLQLIQDHSANQLNMLMKALGIGNEVFLLNDMTANLVSVDTNTGISTIAFERNWLYANEQIYEIPNTEFEVRSWNQHVYAHIVETNSDNRSFVNGTNHDCLKSSEALLSLQEPQVGMSWDISSLPTLFQIISPKVLKYQEQTQAPTPTWKNLSVAFRNGYTGVVQYKDLEDCYLVRINISSTEDVWNNNSSLFAIPSGALVQNNSVISPNFVRSGTYSTFKEVYIRFANGEAFLVGINTNDAADAPNLCGVKTMFEIPKLSSF